MLLSIKEAEEKTGLSYVYIMSLIRAKKIAYEKKDKHYYFDEISLDNLQKIAKNKKEYKKNEKLD